MQKPAPFAILRTEKIKTWSGLAKSVGHNLRVSADDRAHLAPGAEPIRVLLGSAEWVKPWKQLVEAMWLPALKQGTTHTLAREFFLGASPEFFADKSAQEVQEWASVNVAWLTQRFGPERVKLAVLHLDEQTPHIAAYVVGLKADKNRRGEINDRGNGWTLSDGVLGLGGDKKALETLQDEYSVAMEPQALRRGLRKSKATHQKIAQWRAQMARPMDSPVIKPKVAPPTLEDRINAEAYARREADKAAQAVFEQLKPYHQQAKAHAQELARLRALVLHLQPLADAFKRLLERLLGHAPSLNTTRGIGEAEQAIARILPPAAPRAVADPFRTGVSAAQVTPRPGAGLGARRPGL